MSCGCGGRSFVAHAGLASAHSISHAPDNLHGVCQRAVDHALQLHLPSFVDLGMLRSLENLRCGLRL